MIIYVYLFFYPLDQGKRIYFSLAAAVIDLLRGLQS